jgi:hypothetical protein
MDFRIFREGLLRWLRVTVIAVSLSPSWFTSRWHREGNVYKLTPESQTAMPTPTTINPLTEQEEMVFRLCEAGKLTRQEIARQLDVSPARVGQIYVAACAKLKDFAEHGEDALTFLPARARRVVLACGIPRLAQVRAAIATGRLTWTEGIGGIFWEGTMLPKVSRKSWAALHAWAGHPPLP